MNTRSGESVSAQIGKMGTIADLANARWFRIGHGDVPFDAVIIIIRKSWLCAANTNHKSHIKSPILS